MATIPLSKLRLCLTWMNRWEKEGISQATYDKFPNKIKNRYEYKEKLTLAENSDFYRNLYTPIRNEIIGIYSIAKKEADESDFWDINFNRDFN